MEQKTLRTKRKLLQKEVIRSPILSTKYGFISGLWFLAHCFHHIVCVFSGLLLYTVHKHKFSRKHHKLETHLTRKLGVLVTPDAFFGSLLRIGVSGTHLADEWTWFVTEGARLAWKALWGVGDPCVVTGERARRAGPGSPGVVTGERAQRERPVSPCVVTGERA